MSLYIMVDDGDLCVGYNGVPDPADFTGPPTPPPEGPYSYFHVTEKLQLTDPSSPTLRLKWNGGSPVMVETATLDDLRVAKNAAINAAREQANTSFVYATKTIRCLPLDRSDIDGTNGYVSLFGVFPDNWPGGWKATDDTYVAITTIDDWKAFYKAMVDQGNANFHHAQDLKTQLANATTPDQIAAVAW